MVDTLRALQHALEKSNDNLNQLYLDASRKEEFTTMKRIITHTRMRDAVLSFSEQIFYRDITSKFLEQWATWEISWPVSSSYNLASKN
jgi:hypothetical protein